MSENRFPSRRRERAQSQPDSATPTKVEDIFDDNSNRHMPSRTLRRASRRRGLVSKMLVVLVVVAVIGAAAIAVTALGGPQALFSSGSDYEGEGTGSVEVTIPEGASGTQIAKILYRADVVKSEKAFTNAFKKNSLSQGIQPGTYILKRHLPASAAIAALLDPASKADKKITIPEGLTISQFKDRLVSVSDFTAEEIEAALTNETAIGLPKEAGGNAEGWLAPDTYTIELNDTPETLIKRMVDLNIKRLQKANVAQDQWREVLIKASIVEKEMHIKRYRPMVAQVLNNRLSTQNTETNQLLQMDATVLYGVGKSGGIPTQEDLKRDTPYNSYIHKGLPPTPIGAVSSDSIKAVMNPTKGDWYYYVTVNLETGETKFARTNEEQARNTQELRDYCKAHPKICKGDE